MAVVAVLLTVFGVAVAGKWRAAHAPALRRAVQGLWFGPVTLSAAGARRVATAVLAAEVLVVLALAAGAVLGVIQPDRPWALPGLLGAAVVLAVFTAGQAVALRRGRVVPCACFGRVDDTVRPASLVRNAVLLLGAVAGVLVPRFADTGAPALAPALLQAVAGFLVAVLLIELEGIVSLFQPSTSKAVG